MTAGQIISDYTGAAAQLDSLPAAQWMLGERGYDADWFRDALEEKGDKALRSRTEISRNADQIRQEKI